MKVGGCACEKRRAENKQIRKEMGIEGAWLRGEVQIKDGTEEGR